MLQLLLILFAFTSCSTSNHSDENEIKEHANAYIQAYDKKDAKALTELWSENALYVIPESGISIQGKKAIEERFAAQFAKHPDSKLELTNDSVTFPTKNSAVEIATAAIKQNGDVISQNTYKAFYEKQNGKWLITELREVKSYNPPQPSQHLQELEWLIGSWTDKDEDVVINSNYHWDRYKAFMIQNFSVIVEGKFDIEGKQIIGWDPISKQIHSWIFDSDGGFGEGRWRKQDDSWIVETASTLSDGRRASAVNIFHKVDQNSYTWQSVGRSVDGEILPDIDPVTVFRDKQ